MLCGNNSFCMEHYLDKIEVSDNLGALRIRSNGIGDAQAYQFQHQDANNRFDPSVLLSLDYWALIPRKN